MAGASSTFPRTGTRRRKLSAVGKKPLKSRKKPYVSTPKPMTVQPQTTNPKPTQKKREPCSDPYQSPVILCHSYALQQVTYLHPALT